MTEKELRKLKRRDFLQLLLTQGKDMSALETHLDETTKELEQVNATNERLKAKLDEKDELIEKLKGRLDNKDATISELRQEIEDMKASRRIELEQAGSIAMASLRLNGIFEVAQKAADQYLYNIHLMYNELETKCRGEEANQEHLEEALPEQQEEIAPVIDSANQASESNPNANDAENQSQKIGLLEKLRKLGTR